MVAEPSAGGGLVVAQPRPVRQGEHHDTGISTRKREAFGVLANPRSHQHCSLPCLWGLGAINTDCVVGEAMEDAVVLFENSAHVQSQPPWQGLHLGHYKAELHSRGMPTAVQSQELLLLAFA